MSTLVNDGTPGDGIEGLTSTRSRNGVIGRNVSKIRVGSGGNLVGNGVLGITQVPNAAGVVGLSSNNGGKGVVGEATGGDSPIGVLGTGDVGVQGNGAKVGVAGVSPHGTGVSGDSIIGVQGLGVAIGVNGDGGDTGVRGNGDFGVWGTGASVGVLGSAGPQGLAGDFEGKVRIKGSLTKGGGGFKIDHPLDSANKYLSHSFVESPEMKNVYDGVVVLNAKGEALVKLPAWFEALNRDFRYQLTAIGTPGPNLHIAQGISKNSFQIAGGQPKMKVSWQVTGIRKDAWAEGNRVVVEEKKPAKERGYYLHAEAHGQPEERGIMWARHPDHMRKIKEAGEGRKKQASVKKI